MGWRRNIKVLGFITNQRFLCTSLQRNLPQLKVHLCLYRSLIVSNVRGLLFEGINSASSWVINAFEKLEPKRKTKMNFFYQESTFYSCKLSQLSWEKYDRYQLYHTKQLKAGKILHINQAYEYLCNLMGIYTKPVFYIVKLPLDIRNLIMNSKSNCH